VETETGLVFMSDTVLPVSLNNPDFLALASDAFLHATIAQGRRGTAMRGWSQAAGGSLSGAEKRALIAFLRTWSQEMYHPISRRADEAIRAGVVSFTKPPVPIAMAGRGDLGMGLAVTNPDFWRR